MNMRRFAQLAVFAAALLLAAPVAHAAPPKGDSSSTPVNIPVNGTKTVKNVHLATQEPAVDALSTCDGGSTVAHSIWFKFTLDGNARVNFNAGGTLLFYETGVQTRPLAAIFTHSEALGFIQQICDGSTTSIDNVFLSAGEYYVLLGVAYGTLQAGSRYRLNIRAEIMDGLIANFDFNDPLGSEWKLKRVGSPAKLFRSCDSSVDCGVRFDGVAKGKLIQNYSAIPAHLRLIKGDVLMMRVGANATPPGGATIKYTLTVTYGDGRPPTTVTRKAEVVNTDTIATFSILPHLVVDLPTAAVTGAKVTVMSPAADDTFTVENVFFELYAGAYARTAGVLPPPPGP